MDVTVNIKGWAKYNPRKDVKHPSWFALNNRLVEDDEFFNFNHGEFKAWIYVLSKASQKQESAVKISYEAANRKSNISAKDFKSALIKLESLGIVTVDVTSTLRERSANVPLQTDNTDITDRHTNIDQLLDFESLYQKYPRKVGKQKGIEICKRDIKTPADFESLSKAIDRYKAYLTKNKTEARFIKHFSTFMQSWADWSALNAGEADVSTKHFANERDTDFQKEIEEMNGIG